MERQKMAEKLEFYDTLCNNHNQIIFNLKQVKNALKESNIDENTLKLLENSIKTCKYCKKQGQNMENRLRKYRNSIEKLGFKRLNGREMI